MKKLDLYFQYKERIGEATELTVPLEHALHPNFAFLDFISSHWPELKRVFGDTLLKRLSRFSDEESAWNSLLPVAHQNAEMSTDADTALGRFQTLQTSAQGLQFQARTKPRSPQLRSNALRAINSSLGSWLDFLAVDAACDVLLNQFNDDRLFGELEQLQSSGRFTIGPILAMCLGWPNSAPVQGVLSDLNSAHQIVAAYAFLGSAPIRRIIERLPYQLHRAASDTHWGWYIRRPLISRLMRDGDLGAALFEDMVSDPTPWKKAAYAMAIARTQGLTDSGRNWIMQEYQRQESLAYSEFGFDIIYGELRPVAYSLKDALYL